MTIDESKDLLKLMTYLASAIQVRNAARIQAARAPLEDRKMWKQLYKQCVVEVQETSCEIGSLFPSGTFQRKLFIEIG